MKKSLPDSWEETMERINGTPSHIDVKNCVTNLESGETIINYVENEKDWRQEDWDHCIKIRVGSVFESMKKKLTGTDFNQISITPTEGDVVTELPTEQMAEDFILQYIKEQ